MEWITNRQPTEADADKDEDVCVRQNPSSEQDYTYLHWSYVGAGLPWRHSKYWCPPSDPAPEPPAPAPEPQPAPEPVAADRPALAVGQTWRRRDGEVVTIVKNDGSDEWPFETSDGKWYAPNGYLYSALHIDKQDLIELISAAPEPAPVSTARRFVSIRRTILHNRSILDAIDDEGIAWVLHLPAIEWERLIALPAREVPAQQPQP